MKQKNKEADGLNGKQKRFCEEYIFDFNGSRAYKTAYPDMDSDEGARVNASKLLTNANIQAYIKELQGKLEETAGISRLMVLKEHQKLAFSSIAHLHQTWITRTEFESLTAEQKSCIAEIQTQTRTEIKDDGVAVQVDFVKIKLYDKQKSLDSISKMLGYNAAEKMDLNLPETVKGFIIEPASRGTKEDSSQ